MIFLNLSLQKGLFIYAWSPYAVVSLISAFINPNLISPIGSLIPACFAKSSMTWGALYFIFSNREINRKIFKNRKANAFELQGDFIVF